MMAAAVGGVDETIKEYLLYRGFAQSLKWFEQERKDDKDKGFRVRGGLKSESWGGAECMGRLGQRCSFLVLENCFLHCGG